MSSASSSSSVNASSFSVVPTEPVKYKNLQDWWQISPALNDIVDGERIRSECEKDNRLQMPRTLEVPSTSTGCSQAAGKFFAVVRKHWDSASLRVLPHAATPLIIFGVLFALIGLAGTVSSLAGGIHLPGLNFIFQNIPLSIVFSLTLIRAGIHMINTGVMLSRRENRSRQEALQTYRMMRIQELSTGMESQEKARILSEVRRRDNRSIEAQRISHYLKADELYGKEEADASALQVEAFAFKEEIKFYLQHPELDQPAVVNANRAVQAVDEINVAMPAQKRATKSFCDKWYDAWLNALPTLGKIDIALGQIMLAVALTAVVFSIFPSITPGILSPIVNDPCLSITAGLLLLGNWINCTNRGKRMIKFTEREKIRANNERDLLLIEAGLQVKMATDLYYDLKERLAKMANDQSCKGINVANLQRQIDDCFERFQSKIPDEFRARFKEAIKNSSLENLQKNSINKGLLHKFSEKIHPYLPSIGILVGALILLCGIALLTMSATGIVPESLKFLATNTELSVLFSASVIIAGIHAVHRAASMSERKIKESDWKTIPAESAKGILQELEPYLEKPTKSVNSSQTQLTLFLREVDIKMSDERAARIQRAEKMLKGVQKQELSGKGHQLFIQSFKWLALPNMVLGAFLFVAGVAGMAISLGCPATPGLEFLSRDPSFSFTFCFALVVVAIDSFNTSWRMATYLKRKIEDQHDMHVLVNCYYRLLQMPKVNFPPKSAEVNLISRSS